MIPAIFAASSINLSFMFSIVLFDVFICLFQAYMSRNCVYEKPGLCFCADLDRSSPVVIDGERMYEHIHGLDFLLRDPIQGKLKGLLLSIEDFVAAITVAAPDRLDFEPKRKFRGHNFKNIVNSISCLSGPLQIVEIG